MQWNKWKSKTIFKGERFVLVCSRIRFPVKQDLIKSTQNNQQLGKLSFEVSCNIRFFVII